MQSKDTDMYTIVKSRTSDGRVCGSRRDNSAVKNVKSMNSQGKKIMANNDVNSGAISKKKECLDSILKRKELVLGGNNTFPYRSTKMASFTTLAKQEAVISSRNIKGNRERRDGLANLNDGGTALKMLEVGDMVWGRVESHPWWPGEIFDEAFACPLVCNTKKKGHLLVAFYGDNSYGWFEPDGLIPFGPHFIEKSKQTSALGFLTAVGEAKDEVNRRAALGLTCFCRNHNNFRRTCAEGFLEVDVCGFENGSVYPLKQIERARDSFQPIKTLSFLQKLAVMPQNDMQRNVGWMKNVARLLAYRRAVFEEFDETYAQAFGVQPRRPGGLPLVSNDLQGVPPKAPLRSQPVIKKAIAFEIARDRFSSYSKSLKKRPSSEENPPIKKQKTLNETKSSTESKKINQKPFEVLGDEKMAGPTEPTIVFMKFSLESRLPSVSEVKAKFARFGINESETHMFWESSTCQVAFKKVSSAQEAYNYALQNNDLFHNAKVIKYSLRASKVSFADGSGESSRRVVEESPGVVPNLKSCLKKLPDDENGSIHSTTKVDNASLRASKVSFADGSGESRRRVVEESPGVVPNLKSCLKKLPDDENGSIDSTTKVDNALNKKSCQVEARKNESNQSTSSTTTGVDISQQMMILLLKCNDIVTDMMSSST